MNFFMNVYAFLAWLTIDIPISCLFYLFVYIKCMVNVMQLSICSQTTLPKNVRDVSLLTLLVELNCQHYK